ncbi:signal peptide peptidase SppA [Halarcobacter anaerophilus]|uniref:Signal peptide peptidase SppA n=1 Tax=Halarcobacter anaerophilus TaxID=877500 RepID=A0A4Q0Y0B8_9BACT|nr:signal peptide peptidase SppA [Halarcobacter anaerophilus]QDF28169.1 signal peptide peptidase protease IV [Halarcobacter anaerophilus]RXJ62514.1 signal peptide peptidase SppA [Halarcobacter anaerophilus]
MFDFIKKLFYPIIAILDFITKYFKTIVFLTIVYFFVSSSTENAINTDSFQQANLQKIELFGAIMTADKVLAKIEEAKTNKNIKGVLLDVNSPGGAVAPSVELSYAIKELSKIKPVVAYASGVMASGSYYASIWADKIVANPGAMVGSIGVIFQGANFEELMEKVGVKTQTIKAGLYKESGTPTRQWTTYEKEELEKVIKDTYNMFVGDVAKARKLKVEDHTKFANAHIFTSSQAKKVGLVDSVATLSYAKNLIIKLSKVQKPVWKKEDKFDKFLDRVISEAVTNFSVMFNSNLKAY